MPLDFTAEQGANYQFARNGFKGIGDTARVVDKFVAVQIINATVFDVGASATTVAYGDKPIATITYPAGMVVYGPFTAVKLVSGYVHGIYEEQHVAS